jgi:prepilin-type N-terminal cleavage/methylation domain-containing protein
LSENSNKNLNKSGKVYFEHGFTLIELLVVIAVIGLLLSILIPALGRAQGQAALLACKARLRDICISALTYASDNDSVLPYDKSMLGPSHENYAVMGVRISNPHTELIKDLNIENAEVFYCPAQKDIRYCYSEENYASGEIGYFYFSVEKQPATNGSLPSFLYRPSRTDPMKYPRRLLSTMPAETWVASDMWFSGHGGSVPVAHKWYKKGVNYVTLDGSVDMIKQSPRERFR